LINNIRDHGFIKPLKVTSDGTIISGKRRRDAAISLGKKEVPVEILSIFDKLDIEEEFILENLYRKKTNEQLGMEYRTMKRIEADRAKLRQFSKLKQYKNSGNQCSDRENLSERQKVGRARDIAAQKLNISGVTGEHIDCVLSYIEDVEAKGDIQRGRVLRKALNKSIDGAYKLIRYDGKKRSWLDKASKEPPAKGKYRVIVTDPPWSMNNRLDYQTQDLPWIKEYGKRYSDWADDDCFIFMWTISSFLPDSFEILRYWGFEYMFTKVWVKDRGYQPTGWPENNAEYVIVGKKGNPHFTDTKGFKTVFYADRREHSRKPDEFYDIIKKYTVGPRIDDFSREKREGFDQAGNETDKFNGQE